MSDTWSDWDSTVTPPPLPSVPGRPGSATPESMAPESVAAERAAPETNERAQPAANPTRWSLVSLDGRATMRVPKRFVVGSGSCCDLRLSERGIASHHAMLSVEEGIAYVTPMTDSPTLLDGQPIAGRRRLHRDAALTFGAATFRVQHEGPLEAREEPEEEREEEPATDEPAVSHRTVPPLEPEAHRTAPPYISPQLDRARFDRPSLSRREPKTWIAWFIAAAAVAAALWLSSIDAVTTALRPYLESEPAATSAPVPSPTPANSTTTRQPVAEVPNSPTVASPEPAQPVERAAPAAASAPRVSVTPADATAKLLTEADALYAKGDRVTPAGRNAAEHYLRVLQAEPDSRTARASLDKLVSAVAGDASDMIIHQHFDGARRSLDRLAAAIPESGRSLVGKDARNRWRVVELLLDADELMQQYRIVGPDDPNAVALLRQALRIDPNNAIADEMLSKAYGLQAERQKQE